MLGLKNEHFTKFFMNILLKFLYLFAFTTIFLLSSNSRNEIKSEKEHIYPKIRSTSYQRNESSYENLIDVMKIQRRRIDEKFKENFIMTELLNPVSR